MLTRTTTVGAVDVTGADIGHGFTRQTDAVKAIAAANLVRGYTRLTEPLPAQAAKLLGVSVYKVRQALLIVDNPELCAAVIDDATSLWAAVRATKPVKSLVLSSMTPLERAIDTASQLELELAVARYQGRLWQAFERVTAAPIAA